MPSPATPSSPFPVHPVMVLAGTESFLRRQKLAQIQTAVFGGENSPLGCVRLDGSASITAVLDECRTTGMFAERKLVVVDPADALFTSRGRAGAGSSAGSDEEADEGEELAEEGPVPRGAATARDLILRYAEAPCPSSVLVLVCATWLKTTRLHKFLEVQGAILWCMPLGDADLPHWLARRCHEAYGKKLEPAAAMALIELGGADLARLDSELDKLSLYALDQPAITAAMVETLVGFQHEQQVWNLIDALAAGNMPEALRRHEELWSMDAKIGFKIVGPVFYWLRQVLQVRDLLDRRMADGQIIRELKLWPAARATQTLALARRWGAAGCRRAATALLAADLAAKTSVGEPKRNMERFIVELATP